MERRIGQPFGLNFLYKERSSGIGLWPITFPRPQPPACHTARLVPSTASPSGRFATALRVTAAALCGCLEASGRGTSFKSACGAFDHASGADRTGNMAKGKRQSRKVNLLTGRHGTSGEKGRKRLCGGSKGRLQSQTTNDPACIEFSYVYLGSGPAIFDGLDFGPLGRKANTGYS